MSLEHHQEASLVKPSESSQEETPVGEVWSTSVYRDAASNPICDVWIQATRDQGTDNIKIAHVFLRSVEGRDINALEALGLPSDFRIVVADVPPACNFREKTIYIRGLKTHSQFVVLSHEIGHAIQHNETSYASLLATYGSDLENGPMNPLGWKALEAVQKYVPDYGVELSDINELIAVGRAFEEFNNEILEIDRIIVLEKERISKIVSSYFFASFARGPLLALPIRDGLRLRGIEFIGISSGNDHTFLDTDSGDLFLTSYADDVRDSKKNDICNVILKENGEYSLSFELYNATEADDSSEYTASFTVKTRGNQDPLAVTSLDIEQRIEKLEENREDLRKKALEAQGEYAFLSSMEQESITKLLKLPTILVERDATRRALIALRNLKREYGIDLTRELEQGAEGEYEHVRQLSEENIKQGIQAAQGGSYSGASSRLRLDAVKYLNKCLGSYGGDRADNVKNYGKSPRVAYLGLTV